MVNQKQKGGVFIVLNNSLLTIDNFKTGIVVFALVFLAASPAHPAQKAAPSPTPAPTPAQPTQAEPARGRTIFDYKDDLRMTDKQEQDIRTILQNLNKDARLSNARLVIIDSELEDLLNKEGDLDLIRKKLRDAADIRIVMRITDLEATRKINRTLSPEQLKRWRGIQAAAR